MKNTIYKTTDIVLASYLRITGYSMDTPEIVGNKGTFIFKHVDQLVIDNFLCGNAKVEPVQFNNILRSLTVLIRRKIES